MMGNINDTLKVPQNEYLFRAGVIGQKQVVVGILTGGLVKRFADKQLYTEARVLGVVGGLVLTIMEYKKWELIENAGRGLLVPNP